MKTKIRSILLVMALSCLLAGFTKKQTACALVLTNAKTNKSINVCDKNSVQKIEAVLGGAISLDKEVPDSKEPPIFLFTYDGLLIELQNDMIKSLTITGKKWKLNTLTIGIPIEQMTAKFEKHEFNYLGHSRFKVKTPRLFCLQKQIRQIK